MALNVEETKQSDLFKEILQPIRIGNMTIKNRTFMSAMNENMCSMDGAPTDHQIAYYEERAKGGVGMVITGNAFVDDHNSQIASGQLGIYSDRLVPHINRLAETVQRAGSKLVVQLVHGGRQASHAWNKPLWAPSSITCPVTGIEAKEMTIEEIKYTINNFIQGARRAFDAGCDGVEIHFGHGYLLSEFLSNRTNKRTDEYGGSLENNARICIEIIKGIRSLLGNKFVVGVKLNGNEAVEDGITIEQAKIYAKWFEEAGIDYITVTAGIYESGDEQCQSLYIGRGYNVHLATEVKQIVNIPVATVGSINDPNLAGQILRDKKADIISMGRQLIADPQTVNKIAKGTPEDIRLCVRCNDCQGRLVENRVITCAINPEVGKEREYKITSAPVKKRVVVIGGGPGGLEAARVSALRGHEVTLYEKNYRIGGTCLPKENPSFKKELENIPTYYEIQFKKLGVNLKVNTVATPDVIREQKPDVVIVAAGAIPLTFSLEGDQSIQVVQAIDAFNKRGKIGQRVAVLGAGLVGCEAALHFAKQGKEVHLITRRPEDQAAAGLNALAAFRLVTEMKRSGVNIIGNSDVVSIKEGKLVIKNLQTKSESELELDTIAPARGFKPNWELKEELSTFTDEVYLIGDSVKPGTILEAVADGAYVARNI
ncbi:oxidoreductase [Fredinandcohnia sp. FSL W7-1320]|uniref:oxidoreductase n=1 Tax=Fredinandcohnia sp. FSL W7-1320 TaxID=2954540 RepID=UPI0030FD3960